MTYEAMIESRIHDRESCLMIWSSHPWALPSHSCSEPSLTDVVEHKNLGHSRTYFSDSFRALLDINQVYCCDLFLVTLIAYKIVRKYRPLSLWISQRTFRYDKTANMALEPLCLRDPQHRWAMGLWRYTRGSRTLCASHDPCDSRRGWYENL